MVYKLYIYDWHQNSTIILITCEIVKYVTRETLLHTSTTHFLAAMHTDVEARILVCWYLPLYELGMGCMYVHTQSE